MDIDCKQNEKIISSLFEALGYCSEVDYERILGLILDKYDRLKKPLSPELEFLKLQLPHCGGDRYLTELELDKLRLSRIQYGVAAGLAEAEYLYGCHLYEQKEYEKAIPLYKSSADKGFPPSQHCYGLDRFHGIGNLQVNQNEGLTYIKLAAGRLYQLSIEFLIEFYRDNETSEGKENFRTYSLMLRWVSDYSEQ